MFADDTAVYLAVQGPDDSEKLQNDLNLLQEWEEKWDMELNPTKCQVLHITRSRRPIRYNYTMHGQTLDSVEKARYLGVDISSDLSFSHHIDRITTNAQKQKKSWILEKEYNKNSAEGVIAPAGAKVTGATIRTWLLNKFISFLAVLTWKTGLKKM